MTRVLIVEDEPAFADPLAFLLAQNGYEVSLAEDGRGALERFDDTGADLVLLDVMLPGMSGLEVCQTIRRTSHVPIIMVTARDGEVDKVLGLEMGADDYITKPFSGRELVARIRAVLRGRTVDVAAGNTVLESGPVRIDIDAHTVLVRGHETALPLKEFELLELLVRNPGRVLTRDLLLRRVWGDAYDGDGKTLDVHVKRLRGRIEADSKQPRHLLTVRGLGYRFDP